jgi:quinoprotein relay system zinc metallohydrolase 2
MSRRQALLAGFGGACLCCLPSLAAPQSFKMEEVASGVFVRRGVDEDATAQNLDAIANIGFIVGKDAVLVTDTGGSLADGQWLRAQIKAKTAKPIKFVVISHVHPDHTFGAGAFVDDKPVFIGHAKLPEALQARGEFYKKGLADIIGADKVGPVIMPTHTVTDTDQVDLGDRVVTFKAHGPAHTHSDLSMLDKQSGLLLPADLLFVGRIPSLDGSLLGWLKELDALSKMGAQRAVPGHGPVVVDLAPSVAALRGYLGDIRDGVRKEIKGAGSIEAATRSVGQDQASKWALFADYNPRNVTEAYKELEWE